MPDITNNYCLVVQWILLELYIGSLFCSQCCDSSPLGSLSSFYLPENRSLFKLVLGGMRGDALSLPLKNRLNKTESTIFRV